ncbi:MAG: regulator of chromosome condensation [Geobacteraceae bacterium]|nr:MAG: regulator of chromosome condensation [Geobacteraceae bacterium]
MRNWQRLFGLLPPAVMLATLGMADVSLGAAIPQVKAGENHTVMLRANGAIWTCGDNFLGQLGDGTTTARDVPTRLGTATDWVDISAGLYHTMALKADGSLWAWGDNTYGQLGIGTADLVQLTPVQVGTDKNWKSVSAGDYHTVAMKTDGTLWAWGDSADGTLGTGETYSGIIVPTPTQIGAETNWVAAATGNDHTMAVKADGTLWGWGSNQVGQLGDETNLEGRAPIKIGADTDWAAVTNRGSQTVARKKNGTLFTWGLNADGQLGDGTSINKDLPTKVNDDANWTAISSGKNHSVALKDDGTLLAWGDNEDGQCGDGKVELKIATPKPIGTTKDFVALDAGELHTVVMKKNGTIWAMGDNTLGQLCNGTNAASLTPSPGISPNSGDMDVNGDVALADALRALRVTVGLSTPVATEVIAGDVGPLTADNVPAPDGAVTINDAVVILRKVVGLVTSF